MTDTSPQSTRAHRITSVRSMQDGRRDDSMRRRRRVLAAVDHAAAAGDPLSAAALARAAAVDRTFLYRHPDLLEKIHALQADPVTDEHTGPGVTRASLQADLLAAHERAARLNARIQQLEKRLSEALGEQTWRESGLGAPVDIDTLHQRISQLEQHNLHIQQQLDERNDDLAAARAANRELIARLNTPARH